MASAAALPQTITLNARCHCGHASFSYTLPLSAFLLKSSICHCRDCRFSSGQLFDTFAVIPVEERPDFSNLTAYHSSKSLTRYFCPKCGASVGNFEPKEWEFATGVLDRTEGILDRSQMWVGSTNDGGASIWIPGEAYGRKRKGRDSDDLGNDQLAEIPNESVKSSEREKLKAKCHCGAVEFEIAKPRLEPDEKQKRGGEKYQACLCPCNSCRSCSGFEYVSWALYVKPEDILTPDGKQFNVDIPTLEHYQSSSGVNREFCKTCGAKVFYRNDKRDPKTYDICAGLFRGEGARMHDWFAWQTGELDFKSDAKDQEMANRIEKGLQEWNSGKVA